MRSHRHEMRLVCITALKSKLEENLSPETVSLRLTVRSCPSLGYFQFKLNLRPYRDFSVLTCWRCGKAETLNFRLGPKKMKKAPFYFSNVAVCSFVLDKTTEKLRRIHSKIVWVPHVFNVSSIYPKSIFNCQESLFLSSL